MSENIPTPPEPAERCGLCNDPIAYFWPAGRWVHENLNDHGHDALLRRQPEGYELWANAANLVEPDANATYPHGYNVLHDTSPDFQQQLTTTLAHLKAYQAEHPASHERSMAIEHIEQALRWLEADRAVVAAQGHDDYRDGVDI